MKTRLLFALSAIALLLASCAKEQVFEPAMEEDNRIPLNIDGSINQVATRATAAGYDLNALCTPLGGRLLLHPWLGTRKLETLEWLEKMILGFDGIEIT